jgi:hypothetical protein
MMNVQLQNGACDCELFAIAFAIACFWQVEVSQENILFTMIMRRHLYKCLTEGNMKIFPLKPRRTSSC